MSMLDTETKNAAVVLLANPKGGAAKTTATLIITTTLCSYGKSVCVLDADPEKWISDWARLPGCPENMTIIDDVNDANIIDVIEEQRSKYDYVFIDPEGTAGLLVSNAVGMSDYVLIPSQGGSMDGRGAVKTIRMIKSQEKVLRRKISFSVLITRINPGFPTRSLKNLRNELREAGVDVFNNSLEERAVYRDLLDYGGVLNDLDPKKVSNLDKAINNAKGITRELVECIYKATQE